MSEEHASPPPRESAGPNTWLIAILLVLIGVLLFRITMDTLSSPHAILARGDLAEDEKATIELYHQASPSVVHITSLNVQRDRLSLNVMEIPRGTGTGFVWDKDGHIVTNYHVIEGAQLLRVIMEGDAVYQARLIGYDPNNDIAVLKIDAPRHRLIPIPRGTSNQLLVGQKVFAIGNPFGLDRTLTTGVISGLGRQIQAANKRPIYDVIQTDAAINPGNSGGPLLDSAGLLIGVNTAIYTQTGVYAGIGFAVPVDTVNRVVPEIIAKPGRIERPALGISIFPDRIVEQLVEEDSLPRAGVLILDVLPDAGAEQAGLRSTRRLDTGKTRWGDLIIGIEGENVENNEDLLSFLDEKRVGDQVSITYLREGEEYTAQITLQALPMMETISPESP